MSDQPTNQRSLGRGLKSLLGGGESAGKNERFNTPTPYLPKISAGVTNQILQVDINKIKTNPHQPREVFDEYPLSELVQSIKEYGILQPLIVTQVLGGQYELVAGERRLRAARLAGLGKVPAIIRSAKDLEKLELSLIENIQRQDLNPIERAKAYLKLVRVFGLSQDEVAHKMGKSKGAISNSLRLLTLPQEIQTALMKRRISEGQAKVLLELKGTAEQQKVFTKIINTGQTVEQTKNEVARVKGRAAFQRQNSRDLQKESLVGELESYLGTKVTVRKTAPGAGYLKIEFYSEEELVSIIKKIRK